MGFGEQARERLNQVVKAGAQNMMITLENIQKEYDIRRDIVARPKNIEYDVTGDSISPIVMGERYNLTDHSKGQMFARLGIPQKYGEKLMEMGERDLLVQNLMRMTEKTSEEGTLFREVGGTIKGWLSPSYKRMDAVPIFNLYVETMLQKGLVPISGFNTNYRYQLRFIYPNVNEIAKDEYVVYGSSITTGEYGSSALSMEEFIMRVICSNMAIGFDAFRKIHIGKRFEGEGVLSRETHDLDTKAIASAVKDMAEDIHPRMNKMQTILRDRIDKDVNVSTVLSNLNKKGIAKSILQKVQTVYEEDVITELLPAGKGAWRLSNAISLIAQGVEDDTRIDMEKEAFNVLVN